MIFWRQEVHNGPAGQSPCVHCASASYRWGKGPRPTSRPSDPYLAVEVLITVTIHLVWLRGHFCKNTYKTLTVFLAVLHCFYSSFLIYYPWFFLLPIIFVFALNSFGVTLSSYRPFVILFFYLCFMFCFLPLSCFFPVILPVLSLSLLFLKCTVCVLTSSSVSTHLRLVFLVFGYRLPRFPAFACLSKHVETLCL